VDPEQITQIFCPHCRKGVAIRGAIPEESLCPHCEKNFPTAEFAAPQPTHRKSFVSSHPPGNSPGIVKSNNAQVSFDQKVNLALQRLNRHISDTLFWGVGGFAGIVAPFLDGRDQAMGQATIFSTLAFMYLCWLRRYGAMEHQRGLTAHLRGLQQKWRSSTTNSRRSQMQALAGSCLVLACVLLGGANIATLVEVCWRPFSQFELNAWNWSLRALGLPLVVLGGVVQAASSRRARIVSDP